MFIDWILGIDQQQYFNQWDPLTQILMHDNNQQVALAIIRHDLTEGGPYTGFANYTDPTTPAAFVKDMEGYFSVGQSGSNYADAFLGSYTERWWAIPRGNGTATAYFQVTNETDLNAFAHPEFFTGGFIRRIDGAQPEIDTVIAPLDPAAFSPQYETFQWQESISY